MLRAMLLIAALLTGCAAPQAATPYPPALPPDQINARLDSVLAQAAAEDKLAMLVLGANWCHDSTDFVAMVNSPEIKLWLDNHYVIALFGQGYLNHIQAYVQPFGVPTMYGTPTVLIVDPLTRTLRNRDSHYYWRNASQLTVDDARDYFDRYLASPPAPTPISPQLADALRRIDAFEATQAERILQAYADLGNLMREGDAGNPPADFDEKWVSLAKMRGQITTDLAALRESAREQDAAGIAPVALDFPEYSLFIEAE